MKHIVVVCALIERDGRLFAAQRGPGMAHAGLWELPGGKVHVGEEPAAALARELREEFSCEASVGTLFGRTYHAYSGFSIDLTAFRCAVRGDLHSIEHQKTRWVSPQEALELAWTAADVPLVRQWTGAE